MIAFRDFRAVSVFGGQFERGLEEVDEQSGCCIEVRYRSGRRKTLEAPVSEQLSHDGTVLRIPAMADSRSGHDGQPRSEAT
jgi:hypothetical protein